MRCAKIAPKRPVGLVAVCALLALALPACTGIVSSSSNAGSGSTGSGTVGGNTTGSTTANGGATQTEIVPPFSPAPESMHRLTRSQFQNSLTALLGKVTIGQIEGDSYIGGFATVGAGSVVTSSNGVQEYQTAIDAALDQVFADSARRSALVGCTPQTPLDDACAQSFLKTFGRLAWRRPLTQTQLDRYTTLAKNSATALSDSYAGLRWAASALLQSPYFLYRSERGTSVPGKPDRNQYTPYELASKLSFFLWNSTPDAALLDAAESGALATSAGLSAQVDRLLAAPQGHEAIVNFAREFMRTDNLASMPKDAGTYPNYKDTLAAAMASEVLKLWENTAFTSDANALQLFTTRQTFVNKELGALYGLDTSALDANTFSPVTLPANQGRSGLLTTAAMLALEATQLEGSPTLRGRFIRQKFECTKIPDPPPGVVTTLPSTGPGVFTKRQKMVTHEAQPSCSACHGLMDPLGFALEHFDAIGGYRATDSGLQIDTSGTPDDQPFADAVDMGKLLAASPATAPCMVQNIYTYAVGHAVPESEQAVLQDLSKAFASSGNRLRALILKIVTSDGFMFTSPESP
jgi:hypothetical protein